MEKKDSGDWTDEILAGQYVLSVLDEMRAEEVRRRAREDAEFCAKIDHWEQRFASLVPALESVPPPPTVWQNIERELRMAPPPQQAVISLAADSRPFWLRSTFWRSLAAGSVFAAILLAIGSTVFDPRGLRPTAGDQTAWTLMDNEKRAQFVAQWDAGKRAMVVRPLGGERFAGTLHVWAVSNDAQPRYLGTLNADGATTLVIDDPELGAVLQGRELAISMQTDPASGNAAATSDSIILRGIPAPPAR